MKSCWPAPTAGGGGGGDDGSCRHGNDGMEPQVGTGGVSLEDQQEQDVRHPCTDPGFNVCKQPTRGCGDGRQKHGYTAAAEDVLTPAGVSLQIRPPISQTSLQDSFLPSSSGASIHQVLLAVHQLSPHLFWVLNCAKVALFPPLLLLLIFVFLLGLLQSPEEACRDA